MVAAKSEDNGGVKEFQFHKIKQESKWVTFKRVLYDPSNNAVLGRTAKSWGQILLFYSIFYAVLAALFSICMQGLLATLSDTQPKWTLERSLIGINPGLGFRPISNKTEEGSLITYNVTNPGDIAKWVHLIDEFLKPYNATQTGGNYVNCDFDRAPAPGQVCAINLSNLGNCNRNRSYGYNSATPCIFLKLNRIFDWVPEYYTTPHPDMPQDLQEHITNNTSSDAEKNQVWVSCNGVDPVDKENTATFNYYPRGFASYFYPYRNYPNYLSPIVAVEVVNIKPNVIVSIECRAWAKNIKYRGGQRERTGSVQFEIQVDAPTTS